MPNLLQESLMSLYIEMCFDGQLLASGTGFIVKNSENVSISELRGQAIRGI